MHQSLVLFRHPVAAQPTPAQPPALNPFSLFHQPEQPQADPWMLSINCLDELDTLIGLENPLLFNGSDDIFWLK